MVYLRALRALRLRAGTLLALLLLALIGVGCATPAAMLPQTRDRDPVIAEAMRRAGELYLYPDRLDQRMLIGALDALEAPFDPVRFEVLEDRGLLWVGEARAEIPLATDFDPDVFQDTLAAALLFAEQNLGPDPRPEGVNESQTLQLIALNGALHALDRYTTVFSGRDTEDFRIRFSGKLRGIGARIGRRAGDLVAVRVFEDSPASRGGLQDDDAILSIDGEATLPLSVRDAVSRIRGEEGTEVVLRVRRDDGERDVRITRGEVVIPSVEDEDLGDGIGLLRITTVSRTTLSEFQRKLRGLGEIRGLVLDLRGNSGGSMLAAAQIADLFLPSDTIVRVVDKDGRPANGTRGRAIASRRVLVRAPVVVLVDPGTASAAEIISGAIDPLEHVTIVGQTTFGKGLIQRVVPLPDEKLLKLTVGEYLLSDDRAIHEKGVEPDVELFPVSTSDLGRLARVPEHAVPYLIEPEEEDPFPVDFARRLLLEGREAALEQAEADSATRIEASLEDLQWNVNEATSDDEEPLEVTLEPVLLVGGQRTPIRLHVHNRSQQTVPDAWLALGGSMEFLRNQIAVLGSLEPGEQRTVDLELMPPDGLSASLIPLDVHVAAGRRSLQRARLELQVQNHRPDLQITIERLDDARANVTLRNRGCCPVGRVRIVVPSAIEDVDSLPGDSERVVEIPLSGGADTISVILQGAGVRQRIDIPVPEDRIVVEPPSLEVERATRLGRSQVHVSAASREGLREGWLALDGQKEAYLAWNGATDGTLRIPLAEGDHDVTTKIETLSGVSILDSRRLIAD